MNKQLVFREALINEAVKHRFISHDALTDGCACSPFGTVGCIRWLWQGSYGAWQAHVREALGEVMMDQIPSKGAIIYTVHPNMDLAKLASNFDAMLNAGKMRTGVTQGDEHSKTTPLTRPSKRAPRRRTKH